VTGGSRRGPPECSRHARSVVFQPAREIADQLSRPLASSNPQRLSRTRRTPAARFGNRSMMLRPCESGTLDQRLAPEAARIDFESALEPSMMNNLARRIEPRAMRCRSAPAHGGVLGRAFNEPAAVLDAVCRRCRSRPPAPVRRSCGMASICTKPAGPRRILPSVTQVPRQ